MNETDWLRINKEMAKVVKIAQLGASAICKSCGCELGAHEIMLRPGHDDQYTEICWGDRGPCSCKGFEP